jgi:hypothetical protein
VRELRSEEPLSMEEICRFELESVVEVVESNMTGEELIRLAFTIELVLLVEVIGLNMYMFRRLGPPQNSIGAAAHVIEQPLEAGPEPGLITFPQ